MQHKHSFGHHDGALVLVEELHPQDRVICNIRHSEADIELNGPDATRQSHGTVNQQACTISHLRRGLVHY